MGLADPVHTFVTSSTCAGRPLDGKREQHALLSLASVA